MWKDLYFANFVSRVLCAGMWQDSFLKWAPCILHMSSWQLGTGAGNELPGSIYWNILYFYELLENSAFYELRNRRAFVTFILDPPSCAPRMQFMSYVLKEFTKISSTFMSSRRTAPFMSSETWSFPNCCTRAVYELWACGRVWTWRAGSRHRRRPRRGHQVTSAGILEQSMGARNRVGIGLSYRPSRLHRLVESVPWNRFLCSLKV